MSTSIMDENWNVLASALPPDWQALAKSSGAVSQRLRSFDDSIENLFRTLLLHVGRGYSLRETAVRAAASGLAKASDVTLLERLKKAEDWFRQICLRLIDENQIGLSKLKPGINFRAVDGSNVKEPGQTGSEWRVHYSVSLPDLVCDYFDITATKGKDTRESLTKIPIKPGDHVLADRGFSRAADISHVHKNGGFLLVRVATQTLPLYQENGERFDLLGAVNGLANAGEISSWSVAVKTIDGKFIKVRLCALRKSEEQIALAHKRIKKKASKNGTKTREKTLEFAKYVIVVTTFSETNFSASEILECYRLRWQVELVFKRLKSLLKLGHIPKHDDVSCRAWLYGKLVVSLLAEKLARLGRAFSPWGYDLVCQEMP